MPLVPSRFRTRRPKFAAVIVIATAGFTLAALVGVAFAATFTLHVAKNARVTNQTGHTVTENIVATSRGFAVYELSGDSQRHPECTKAKRCFGVWPPVTVSSRSKLTKGPGVKGSLGIWHRNGFLQVTLAGHPLYRYAGDSQRSHAVGEGIRSFGGTWHVIRG